MGASSNVITEGDCAFDILFSYSQPLVKRIEFLFENPETLEPDDAGALECALIVSMLVALDKADLMCGYPSPDLVTDWRDRYFKIFDDFAAEQQDWEKESTKERRKELRKPFNRLIRICRDKH